MGRGGQFKTIKKYIFLHFSSKNQKKQPILCSISIPPHPINKQPQAVISPNHPLTLSDRVEQNQKKDV
jgi:hypothetical protein